MGILMRSGAPSWSPVESCGVPQRNTIEVVEDELDLYHADEDMESTSDRRPRRSFM